MTYDGSPVGMRPHGDQGKVNDHAGAPHRSAANKLRRARELRAHCRAALAEAEHDYGDACHRVDSREEQRELQATIEELQHALTHCQRCGVATRYERWSLLCAACEAALVAEADEVLGGGESEEGAPF